MTTTTTTTRDTIRSRRKNLASKYNNDLSALANNQEWLYLSKLDRFEPAEMLECLNRVYSRARKTQGITILDVRTYDDERDAWMPSSRSVKHKFESWRDACKEARVPSGAPGKRPMNKHSAGQLCQKSIIVACQAIGTHYIMLTLREYDDFYRLNKQDYKGLMSSWKIRKYFGGATQSWVYAKQVLFPKPDAFPVPLN